MKKITKIFIGSITLLSVLTTFGIALLLTGDTKQTQQEQKIVFHRTESADSENGIELEFKGANQNPAVEGVGKLPGVAHFYTGNDPTKVVK